MERIIVDRYVKGEKHIWGNDPNMEFNKKILCINEMFGWLYNQGILEKVSFEFKDYSDCAHFAVDTKDLTVYRDQMEASGLPNASLAVRHIFDEPYTPCQYSGAIELGWTMSSYRDVDGSVGRSWECGLVQSLNTEGIYDVLNMQQKSGVKEAVKTLFASLDWLPSDLGKEKSIEAVMEEAREIAENNFSGVTDATEKSRIDKPER